MKKILSITAISLATMGLGLIATSCKTDGLEEKSIGELDKEWNSDLPDGYRPKTVGQIRYIYKNNGKLDVIRINGVEYDVNGKTITVQEGTSKSEYKLTFNASNYITKIEYNFSDADQAEEYNEKGKGTIKLSYSIDDQVNKITTTYSSEGTDEGENFSFDSEAEIEYTYSTLHMRRVKLTNKSTEVWGGEKETTRSTTNIGFEFDDGLDYLNHYNQWTPNLVLYTMFNDPQDIFGALAYIGVFGRATSQLPEKIIVEVSGNSSVEGDYTENDTYRCHYEKNTYGAIREADGITYSYTNEDEEYEVKAFVDTEAPAAQPAKAPRFNLFVHRGNK